MSWLASYIARLSQWGVRGGGGGGGQQPVDLAHKGNVFDLEIKRKNSHLLIGYNDIHLLLCFYIYFMTAGLRLKIHDFFIYCMMYTQQRLVKFSLVSS
jgi:hypothetical protein